MTYIVSGGVLNSTHSLTLFLVVLFTTASTPKISDCPLFVGPAKINITHIEFYCYINTTTADRRARFNVSFMFNFEVDAGVPVQVLDVTNLRATLHEQYLAGRLNKAVRYSISVLACSQ